MKHEISILSVLLALSAAAVAPQLDVTSMEFDGSSLKVAYTLAADAIVTMDVLTNVTGTASGNVFASVGGPALANVKGDVFKRVPAGSGTITWKAYRSVVGVSLPANAAKVEVKAWATYDPPDYLIVNMDEENAVTYYPSKELLPQPLDSEICKWKKLPMRRIHARGVEWTMGTGGETGRTAASEKAHSVTLDHDYYMAVYELSKGQYGALRGYWSSESYMGETVRTIPLQNYPYDEFYGKNVHYPNPPTGVLKSINDALPALAFDLPSEAEWEFAARGGHGESRWGNGGSITAETSDPECSKIARYIGTNPAGWKGSYVAVGSYQPNDYDLYDMNGNVREWCLDWYQADITWNASGEPNAKGSFFADGVTPRAANDPVVVRGGCYASNAKETRASYREGDDPTQYHGQNGVRFVTRTGLK